MKRLWIFDDMATLRSMEPMLEARGDVGRTVHQLQRGHVRGISVQRVEWLTCSPMTARLLANLAPCLAQEAQALGESARDRLRALDYLAASRSLP